VKPLFGGTRALDDGMRNEHAYLTAADQCWWLAEYHPGRSYRVSALNRLIVNLKCRPSIALADPRRMHYKTRAIDEVARVLRAAMSRSPVESAT